jgi:hypothetical protein
MPQQILKDVHGRRIGILPQNGETRKSLRDKQERIFRVDSNLSGIVRFRLVPISLAGDV